MAKVVFTAGRVSGFKYDPAKQQAFMWDVTAPGLGLRATPAGKPAYIFQSECQGKTVCLTIGSPIQLASIAGKSWREFANTVSASGTLVIPRNPHNDLCKVAGIDGLTIHGLRRSFKSLTEWLEIPAGVVAQIMGHKPSATAEKHYTVRPLGLLRVHHEKIEAWILEQGKVTFDAKAEPGKLRVVVG